MSPEVIESLLFILAGWLLSTLTTFIAYLVNRRRNTRKVFTDLKRIIEDLMIRIELTRAWRKAGLIETIPGLFELDESWKSNIPIEPPELPEQFEYVISSVSEWEAKKGRYSLTKKLFGLKYSLRVLNNIYTGFVSYAKQNESDKIPNRTINIYKGKFEELEESLHDFHTKILPLQKTWLFRKKDTLKSKLRLYYYKRFKNNKKD